MEIFVGRMCVYVCVEIEWLPENDSSALDRIGHTRPTSVCCPERLSKRFWALASIIFERRCLENEGIDDLFNNRFSNECQLNIKNVNFSWWLFFREDFYAQDLTSIQETFLLSFFSPLMKNFSTKTSGSVKWKIIATFWIFLVRSFLSRCACRSYNCPCSFESQHHACLCIKSSCFPVLFSSLFSHLPRLFSSASD